VKVKRKKEVIKKKKMGEIGILMGILKMWIDGENDD
jgi:hypothetical protein